MFAQSEIKYLWFNFSWMNGVHREHRCGNMCETEIRRKIIFQTMEIFQRVTERKSWTSAASENWQKEFGLIFAPFMSRFRSTLMDDETLPYSIEYLKLCQKIGNLKSFTDTATLRISTCKSGIDHSLIYRTNYEFENFVRGFISTN